MHTNSSPLARARSAVAGALVYVGTFSLAINLLGLVGPIYMLQVYDRVLASRSETTLVLLTLLVAGLYIGLSLLETARAMVLSSAGRLFEAPVAQPLFDAALEATRHGRADLPAQYFRDLTRVREFSAGPGFVALCDLPWFPLYLAVTFLLHPAIGFLSLAGAMVILLLTILAEGLTRTPLEQSGSASREEMAFISTAFRNAEVIRAMGMRGHLRERWQRYRGQALQWSIVGAQRGAGVLAAIRFARLFIQSAVLGLGALLVIRGELTGGSMIAASILMGRALAPIEQAMVQWKAFLGAREAWSRIAGLFSMAKPEPELLELPPPKGALAVAGLQAAAPLQRQPFLRSISFTLVPGETLVVIGPSASGKSTLARTLVGAWPLLGGTLRIDGADLGQWNPDRLGRYIGYLPQDIELFPGTVGDNIARLGSRDDAEVVAAARLAGVHDLILQLPDGYETEIGDSGHILSGGLRQRVGLARAVYGSPCLVVLDEPNSSLDGPGNEALAAALRALKASGTTVVAITHRPDLIALADKILVLENGQMAKLTSLDEVRNTGPGRGTSQAPVLRSVTEQP